jgi:hypothetical protein
MARKPKEIRHLYMYSGAISYPHGSPTLMDVAISLSREGRYAGAGMRWYPVALHLFVVCDMLPDELKLDGLMHDWSECITGDMPKPAKTKEMEILEEKFTRMFYRAFKVPFPKPQIRAIVKEADRKALRGEVYTVGTQALQKVYPRCQEAEVLTLKYVNQYSYADCLEAGGLVPIEFMKRFREYSDLRK